MHRKFLTIIIILFSISCAVKAQEAKGLWAGAFEASDIFAAIGVNFDESKVVLRFAGQEQTGALKDLQVKEPPPEAVALFLRPRRCAITG